MVLYLIVNMTTTIGVDSILCSFICKVLKVKEKESLTGVESILKAEEKTINMSQLTQGHFKNVLMKGDRQLCLIW